MKSIVKMGLSIGLALSLAACVTTRDRMLRYEQQCKEYGFKRNTDAMAQCVQKLDTPS
jgi:hypothetical protein